MLRRIITEDIATFMVRIVELASIEFYGGDRALAFKDLNDRRIWHCFIEKYEEKRGLEAEIIVDEIREMLGREKTALGDALLLNDGDTEFIRSFIREIAKRYNWNYSVSFERFYSSDVCKILSNANLSLSAFTLDEMLELFDNSVKQIHES